MSGNTRNAIEALATAKAVVLTGAALGNDRNAIEQIATAKAVAVPTARNDDNALADLTAELP